MNYAAHLLTYFGIYALAALSLNLVVGYLGLLSLAHAVFFAIGAYAWALSSVAFGVSWPAAVLAGALCAALASLPLALAADRFRGGFFILVSLAFAVLAFNLLRNAWSPGAPLGSLANLTNGVFGIAAVPAPTILGVALATPLQWALLSLTTLALGAALCHRLLHSPWGRMLRALRDDEPAARSLGKPARRARVTVFALAGALAAVAGALYAGYVSYVDAQLAGLDESILLLTMVVVGGAGNFRGPLAGTAVVLAVPEILRLLPLDGTMAAHLRVMLFGLFIVLVLRWRPQGIAGEYRIL